MKTIKITTLSILALSILICTSCKRKGCTNELATNYESKAKKDDGTCFFSEGCMDCNATNYDSSAVIDDSSCLYSNNDRLGFYTVHDSIFGPPILEWYHHTYEIEIYRSHCSPNELVINNYANKNNQFISTPYGITIDVDNNSISNTLQTVNDITVRTNTGYFVNDSIYLDIEYENEFGEVFYGKCYGIIN